MLVLSNNLYLNTISFFPDCQELCVKKKLDENLFHQASFYFLICYFIFIYKFDEDCNLNFNEKYYLLINT